MSNSSNVHRSNNKYNDNGNGYESIPFIDNNLQTERKRRNSESDTSVSSENTEISLPIDAPIVQQRRCSNDIDTIELGYKNSRKNGIMHTNTYLDTSEYRDSIQDIM